MACDEVKKQLGAYLDEELAPAEKETVASHLDTCLLIVDIDLPGASGLELVERMDLETRPLPVVLLTGSAGDDATWQAEARRVGALALLRKPVEADECWR